MLTAGICADTNGPCATELDADEGKEAHEHRPVVQWAFPHIVLCFGILLDDDSLPSQHLSEFVTPTNPVAPKVQLPVSAESGYELWDLIWRQSLNVHANNV